MGSRLPVLVNREFTRLWFAHSASQFGDLVSDTALLLWVGVLLLGGRPQAPVVSGAMLLTATAVSLVVAPVAGVLVDRWDERRVMLCADAVRGVVTGLFGLALLAPPERLGVDARLWLGFGVIVVSSAAAQFHAPARIVLLRDVVPPDRLGRASGYNQTTYAVLSICAPALAALLVFGIGMAATLLVDAATFLLSWLAVRSLRTAAPAAGGEREARDRFRDRLVGGLRAAFGSRALSGLLAAIGLAGLATSAMTALMVYFVQYNLHADGVWFGAVESALALGAVAGGLPAGRLGDRVGHWRVYGASLLALGLLVVGYARLTAVTPALLVACGIGAALGAANAVFVPLLVGLVRRSELSRVYSLVNTTSQTASLLSLVVSIGLAGSLLTRSAEISALGLRMGPIDAIFTVAGLLCVVAGCCVLRVRDGTAVAGAADARPGPAREQPRNA
ncbi:MFS transporter [Saccharothrix algeriensis]|uniref:MFS family permease n=1 Tax=Saccharothrix algeriensis TaxID=173560 RepID=A0A8T8HX16_9PSEU|nr:MFS transporter [Saccharothrix algeriensis]MBM7814769.1 MFS family permease [Saccharothrix algeriensis]QTR03048.1 MFS transporter [Saccharothrix algeriensis]